MLENKKYLILFLLLLTSQVFAAMPKTVRPYYGDLQQSFTELAQTRLQDIYTINVPVSGVLNRVTLAEGTMVKKNQVVAQMAQEPLIHAKKEAYESMVTFQAWYDLHVKMLSRQQALLKKGYSTQQEVDRQQAYVTMLAAQEKKNKAALKTAQYDLQRATMLAPIDGVILKRYTQGGNWQMAGTPVLDIGVLKNIEVICDVLTEDAQLLQVNGKAVLTSIGNPIVLHGIITRIEPNAFTKQSALGVDEQRVNVIMKIDEDPRVANLGIGYRLQAQFLVGAAIKNKLLIPRFSVLQNTSGQYYVIKKQNKKLIKQVVTLAGKTDNQIAVASGLSPNDEIVAEPTSDM
jgi:HlyD family secretion protein